MKRILVIFILVLLLVPNVAFAIISDSYPDLKNDVEGSYVLVTDYWDPNELYDVFVSNSPFVYQAGNNRLYCSGDIYRYHQTSSGSDWGDTIYSTSCGLSFNYGSYNVYFCNYDILYDGSADIYIAQTSEPVISEPYIDFSIMENQIGESNSWSNPYEEVIDFYCEYENFQTGHITVLLQDGVGGEIIQRWDWVDAPSNGFLYIPSEYVMWNNGQYDEYGNVMEENCFTVFDGNYNPDGIGLNYSDGYNFHLQIPQYISTNYTTGNNYPKNLLVQKYGYDDLTMDFNGFNIPLPNTQNVNLDYTSLPWIDGYNSILIKDSNDNVLWSFSWDENNSNLPDDTTEYDADEIGTVLTANGSSTMGSDVESGEYNDEFSSLLGKLQELKLEMENGNAQAIYDFQNVIDELTELTTSVNNAFGQYNDEFLALDTALQQTNQAMNDMLNSINSQTGEYNDELSQINSSISLQSGQYNDELNDINDSINSMKDELLNAMQAGSDYATVGELTSGSSTLNDSIISKLPIDGLQNSFNKLASIDAGDYATLRPNITINLSKLFTAGVEHIAPSLLSQNVFDDVETTFVDFSVLEQIEFGGMSVIEYFRLLSGSFMVIMTGMYFYRNLIPKNTLPE